MAGERRNFQNVVLIVDLVSEGNTNTVIVLYLQVVSYALAIYTLMKHTVRVQSRQLKNRAIMGLVRVSSYKSLKYKGYDINAYNMITNYFNRNS